jgi:hypothetical protein
MKTLITIIISLVLFSCNKPDESISPITEDSITATIKFSDKGTYQIYANIEGVLFREDTKNQTVTYKIKDNHNSEGKVEIYLTSSVPTLFTIDVGKGSNPYYHQANGCKLFQYNVNTTYVKY